MHGGVLLRVPLEKVWAGVWLHLGGPSSGRKEELTAATPHPGTTMCTTCVVHQSTCQQEMMADRQMAPLKAIVF